MMPALAEATIHHIAGAKDRPPHHLGSLNMASAEDKLDQVLAAVNTMRVDVGVLAAKLDAAGDKTSTHTGQLADVEQRLRALEAWRWQMLGAAGLLGGLLGAASSFIVERLLGQ